MKNDCQTKSRFYNKSGRLYSVILAVASSFLFLVTQGIADDKIDVTSPPYNAKGDGVTYDTSAIQAAAYAARDAGKRLYFPKGNYLYNSSITFYGSIYGDRMGLSTLISDDASGPSVWPIYFMGQNSKVSDLTFKRKDYVANNTGAELVNVIGSANSVLNNVKFERCEVTQATSFGLFAKYVDNIVLDDCVIHDNGADGAHFDLCTRVKVINSHFYNNGDDPIAFTSLNDNGACVNLLIADNFIEHSANTRCVLLEGVNNAIVRGNIISKTGNLEAIGIVKITNGQDPSMISIEGNSITRDYQGMCVCVYGNTADVRITNNTFVGGSRGVGTSLGNFAPISPLIITNNDFQTSGSPSNPGTAISFEDRAVMSSLISGNYISSALGGMYLGTNNYIHVTNNVIFYNSANAGTAYGILATALIEKFFSNNSVKKLSTNGLDIDQSALDGINTYDNAGWGDLRKNFFPGRTFTSNADSGNTYPPTTGTWKQGDIVLNAKFVSAGGYIGWVCIAGGSPGTWKTWGAVSP